MMLASDPLIDQQEAARQALAADVAAQVEYIVLHQMIGEVLLMQVARPYRRVLIDAVWPTTGAVREVILVLAGALLIALAAQLRIPLPFSPVPVTGQTFAVLLLGSLYGSRRGAATVVGYLVLGGVGLPVFAGGAAGLARFTGPTGGYLVGFVAAAFVVGLLSERGWDHRPSRIAAGMIIGNVVIYAAGILWLRGFVGWEAVLATGVLPFLPGDALKIALATVLVPSGWRIVGRASWQTDMPPDGAS